MAHLEKHVNDTQISSDEDSEEDSEEDSDEDSDIDEFDTDEEDLEEDTNEDTGENSEDDTENDPNKTNSANSSSSPTHIRTKNYDCDLCNGSGISHYDDDIWGPCTDCANCDAPLTLSQREYIESMQ